ncbi:glycosyltransferase family 2 protein [Naasia sp. SYSU D00948]|uniref:glycosyltransferase family 2 protein n=1 Tax=Naasia sp. SYSU D00948 TaxID=2817379 RepID=UPI001B308D53|nr:glycosyltransferase family 2 protein [Naasia sp. SYSU D00948]
MAGTIVRTRAAVRLERRHRERDERRLLLVRVVAVLTVVLGLNYIGWRWLFSLNWDAAWIAIPLVVAETYSLIDVTLFALTVWRARRRTQAPVAPAGLTVDVFVTTYDEPVELVLDTVEAAKRITYPHLTWILDDGDRPELRRAAERAGVGYVTRGQDWHDRPRHAKAGNLNNAMMSTEGEFILILDADQVPEPEILDRTLGWFTDPRVALVQTPQEFRNVPARDPLGSDAPLFYGPIQQGKDGWNAAFFCGSNAILRREALMHLAIARYVAQVERNVHRALKQAHRVLTRALARDNGDDPLLDAALAALEHAVRETRRALAQGEPVGLCTFRLQRAVEEIAEEMVSVQLRELAADLADLGEVEAAQFAGSPPSETLHQLATGEASPLAAFAKVQALIRSIDVDLGGEAQPLMPLATISVTEDMATAMRLHAAGWKSVYHHETLAWGLAPEDLRTMMRQRLRWAQGTVQVMLRENPLVQRGLTLAQRLMYTATMWSYLSGFATVVYFLAPALFLTVGILPVDAGAVEFLLRFLPFLAVNRLLFLVASRGIPTRRGRQYSVALFPVWIRATRTAIGNVVFKRPLDFVVTPKTRQLGGVPWRLIFWQCAAAAVLLLASVVGVVRILLGVAEPVGTLVNLVWVGVDLAALAVLVPAIRYRGFGTEKGAIS